MQDIQITTGQRPDTQHWTQAEKAKLAKIAPLSTRKAQLRAMFPGRTLSAIKLKLFATRRELGLAKRGTTGNLALYEKATTMLDRDDPGVFALTWADAQRPDFIKSNAQYLAALGIAA